MLCFTQAKHKHCFLCELVLREGLWQDGVVLREGLWQDCVVLREGLWQDGVVLREVLWQDGVVLREGLWFPRFQDGVVLPRSMIETSQKKLKLIHTVAKT